MGSIIQIWLSCFDTHINNDPENQKFFQKYLKNLCSPTLDDNYFRPVQPEHFST